MRFAFFIAAAVFVLSPLMASAQMPPPFGGSQNTYMCHKISGARALQYKANAIDQFGNTQFDILEAVRICNPMEGEFENPINGEGGDFPMVEPEIHYVCYRIAIGNTTALRKRFEVDNQLAENQEYESDQPEEVCLPSVKRH
ncbi:MAG: hypothetical protein QNJ16_02845 [Rhodobacter sp.]|nr:hypothetical protein [Rhodobacter sp.]